jgi:hypothetical protein
MMPEKKEKQEAPKRKSLIAFAPFVFGGNVYSAGSPFDPAGLERDPAFDETHETGRRRGGTTDKAITFISNGKRVILPVKEIEQ